MQVRGSFIVRDSYTICDSFSVCDLYVCVWDVVRVCVILSGVVYDHRVKLMELMCRFVAAV